MSLVGRDEELQRLDDLLAALPGRCHFTLVQGGWERVADDVLAWALRQ
jgi:hypothetical protein